MLASLDIAHRNTGFLDTLGTLDFTLIEEQRCSIVGFLNVTYIDGTASPATNLAGYDIFLDGLLTDFPTMRHPNGRHEFNIAFLTILLDSGEHTIVIKGQAPNFAEFYWNGLLKVYPENFVN